MTPKGARRLAILLVVLTVGATGFFVLRKSFSIVPLVAPLVKKTWDTNARSCPP